jgi:hypothetical protein
VTLAHITVYEKTLEAQRVGKGELVVEKRHDVTNCLTKKRSDEGTWYISDG